MAVSGFIATAPTLNSNVTQQSLVLGMLGIPLSPMIVVLQGRGKLRDAPSAPLVTFTFSTVNSP